jgi:HSP90 family molecular chaperone
MRDVGYTLDTALADIVDNSVAAGAASVRILADTASTQPSIGIVDDGIGMTAEELLEAMRLGNRSPLDERMLGDLGRFGLGLKTASFSQCRPHSVAA